MSFEEWLKTLPKYCVHTDSARAGWEAGRAVGRGDERCPECFRPGCNECLGGRCIECGGTGENRDAMQAWDIPGAPVPECGACDGEGRSPAKQEKP